MMPTHCVFDLPDGCYALDVGLVIEVVPYEAPRPLPGCPSAVLGLMQRRGQALAAVDLGAVLGVAPAASGVQWLILGARAPLAAVPISALHGVAPAVAAHCRRPDAGADPAWVVGFQDYPALPGRTAAVIAATTLLSRLDALRFHTDHRAAIP